MTIAPPRRSLAVAVVVVAVAGTVTSCATEYHGYNSGIDGVLWRQVASFEDPLSARLYAPGMDGSAAYLETLDAQRWDGRGPSTVDLDVESGGIILYDISSTPRSAEVSVFIASGPRPAVPRDDGGAYSGPSQVYTCYAVEVSFASSVAPSASRVTLDECPQPLVELLPEDAAFASGEVFDG